MRGTFGQSAMGQSSDCVCIVRTLARRHKFNRSCLVPGQPSFSAPQPNSISQISPREVTRAGSRQMVAQPPFGFTDPQGSALHSSTRFSVGLVSMKGASSNFDRPSCPTRTTETVVSSSMIAVKRCQEPGNRNHRLATSPRPEATCDQSPTNGFRALIPPSSDSPWTTTSSVFTPRRDHGQG